MSKATGARDAEPTGAGAASAPPLQDRADDDDYDEDNEEGQDIVRAAARALTGRNRRQGGQTRARLLPPFTSRPAAAAAAPSRVQGLTPNQRRLLYMISLYTKPASSAAEKEEWVRRQALLVLIYEGIVKQVFDYDYAPISTIINDQRTFFNVSQEGSSDIDFLREEGLLNNLKRSSSTYLPVSCYQISARGGDLIRRVGRTDKEAVHEVVYAPGTRDLLQAVWRNRKWYLLAGGYEMESSVTDCEDVSYVGSAYVPQCLRFGGRPTLSNAHRSAECARAASNIRDVLDEIITLNSVSVVIAEYVPFGANNVAQVNSNLGSADRVSGGFFSAVVDDDAGGTRFAVEAGLTRVNVLDYSHTRHVNFEADIYMPEEAGIIQVETLGISVNADGTVFHGMQIEAVMDRIKDNISLDQLSRLLVDVTIDSSTMLDSVISAHQRKLLSIIYSGNATARDKVNLIIANEITPHLTAEEYMDKGDYENELKQVLGETRAAFDISEHDTLIFGSNGLLIAGPNARLHEPLLCSYMQFNAMDLFIRNFFARTFLLNDDMRVLRRAINNYHTDPFATSKINERLQHVSDEVRLMSEILGYLIESLETCEIPAAPADPSGKALYQRLQIADLAAQLSMRVLDLKKLMDGTRAELMVSQRLRRCCQSWPAARAHAADCLSRHASARTASSSTFPHSRVASAAPAPPGQGRHGGPPAEVAQRQPRHDDAARAGQQRQRAHTVDAVDDVSVCASGSMSTGMTRTRSAVVLRSDAVCTTGPLLPLYPLHLRCSMLILAGMLAFDILDRLTGSWTVMDSDWMQDFANPMIKKKPVRRRVADRAVSPLPLYGPLILFTLTCLLPHL